ncbi:hypothetical protein [Glycomyces sp. NPDC048151]
MFVKLCHPKTGGEWMCPEAAVEAWLAKGWKKADAPAAAPTTGKDK